MCANVQCLISGSHCEVFTTYCTLSDIASNDPPACHNGGTCYGQKKNFTCSCAPGFAGKYHSFQDFFQKSQNCQVTAKFSPFLACLNNFQEELLYYSQCGVAMALALASASANVKVLH